MRMIKRFALSAICGAISAAAWAQSTPTAADPATPPGEAVQAGGGKVLETVTVTATKRRQAVRDVPQSIEAYSQIMLEDMGAKDVSDVVKATPGVELRATQAGTGGVAIRGITELNLFNLTGGTGSATGLYLDEIPMTAAGFFPEVNTFDLERVEILKGPQGTLFGEGSLAGTIRLITRKPDTRSVSGAVDVETFSVNGGGQGHNINGMLNVPLAKDTAGLRITVYDREDPGYIDTKLSSSGAIVKDTNTNKTRGGRIALRLTPDAAQTIDATLMSSDSTRGGTSRATDGFVGLHSVLEGNTDNIKIGSVTWQLKATGADYLVSLSKMKRDLKQVTDQMGLLPLTNQLYGAFGLPPATGAYAPQDVTTDTTAFEARAVSNGGGPLKWTVGTFYKKHDYTYRLTSQTDPLTPPAAYSAISRALTGGAFSDGFAILGATQASTKQSALFGETSYDLSPSLQVLGGLRLFREERESTTQYGGVILYVPAAFGGPITPPGTATTSATDNIINPRLTLSYKPAPGVMTFASVSRGFRSGGQNDLFFSVTGGKPTYEPETATSYEVGFKSELLNRKMFFDASLFTMDWNNLQAVVGEGPGGAGEVIGNIGKARSTGLDLSVRARPIPELELQAGLSLLDAVTKDAVTLPDPSGTGSITVASGARIPRTAKQSMNLAATYRTSINDSLTGMLRVGITRVGDSVAQVYHQDAKIDAYTTADLKLGVESEKWSIYTYVTNLTNQAVQLFRDPNNETGTGKPQIYYGRPRTMGVDLKYFF